MNNDIYISASRRDFEVVSKIKSILHSAGYTYYYDRHSFQQASDFEQTTTIEIISSKVFLCILSGNSSSSVFVREELRYALKENKIIIPLIIDDAELVNLGEIGHLLLEIPVIRLNPYDSKSAKVILLNEIEKRCGTKVQKETLVPCANDIKNVQYDVFISCKSEDYPFARKVYQYLREHNYNVFLADTELRKKGNAEYGKIIDEALDSATHMIIIASKPEYIQSTYVESEWRIFIEEKRSGRKKGNIITIINFNVSLLPIGLRQYQFFDINAYDNIVDYLILNSQIINNDKHEQIEELKQSKKKTNAQTIRIKYRHLSNEALLALYNISKDIDACFEIGLRYFLGIKDKYQSENMAKYYFNKAGLSFDEALKLIKLDNAEIALLSNDVLLDLCKNGDKEACIEMGLRYFRGVKGKNKSIYMAKYYWQKGGTSYEEILNGNI